jgi:hypothetical protein
MKQKQLANVLIKVLGLSLCSESVMHLVMGLMNLLSNFENRGLLGAGFTSWSSLSLWSNVFSGLLLAVLGIYFIVASRKVAEWLLKGEED